MEKPCLNDKEEYPDDKVLSRALGKLKPVWDAFLDFIHERYPAITGEWRYYRDGKSWLYKLTKKKQTICWISVYHGAFKTTFYFSDKAEERITASKGLRQNNCCNLDLRRISFRHDERSYYAAEIPGR